MLKNIEKKINRKEYALPYYYYYYYQRYSAASCCAAFSYKPHVDVGTRLLIDAEDKREHMSLSEESGQVGEEDAPGCLNRTQRVVAAADDEHRWIESVLVCMVL